ncbi:DnaJ domain-containing protein [Coniochaeta hoffmannii]|uniref:DnaJ domain-containing protein n=1 Tax=Coniochaeta hoffmannii TaxID=91930 RepID=A0AA38VXZ9_9PEZI|nr:DnaJ domain-containing protein [Coniochaeta hoffmannii]
MKADMSRDYYADLELPANADINEVKKQFRKLALKYHPDRNPGRESEVNSKFQTIQSAHEILTSPEQKAKYDAHRSRTSSRYPTASGVRGNPWQDVASNFPPPPRRPPMPTRPSAASRYSSWQTPAQKSPRDDPNAAARAWDRMRPGSSRQSHHATGPSGSTSNTGSRRTPTRPMDPPPPPPRTEAQRKKAEASFGTRKTNFTQAVPDEPPAASSSYTTRRANVFSQAAEAAKQQKNAESDYIDPLSKQFQETFVDGRQRTPYSAHTGEKFNPFDGTNVNRGRSVRDNLRNGSVSGSTAQPATPPSRRRSASVPDEADTKQSPGRSRAGYTYKPPSTSLFDEFGSSGTTNSDIPPANGIFSGKAKEGSNVFDMPVDDDTFSPTNEHQRFMRKSADSINTKFVADNFSANDWQFNAGKPDEDAFLAAKKRAARATRRGTQSPKKNGLNVSQETASDPQLNTQTQTTNSGFDASEWTEKIGPEVFVPRPPPRNASASPTKANRPIKKAKPVRMTAGTAGLVDEDESSSSDDKTRPGTAMGSTDNTAPVTTDSPVAMDIDTPPPEPEKTNTAPKAARNIPVEPSKPEWRAGNAAGVATTESTTPPDLNRMGSEDSSDFLFSEFKNVAPFAPQSGGLGSLGDLKSSLPFESKAAPRLAVEKEPAKPLPFPACPKSPRPPPVLAVSNLKPSHDSWVKYVHEFHRYMEQWAEFNAQVTDHFVARKNLINESKKLTGFSWVEARGDAGIRKYLQWCEEDKIVRQKWMAACEGHELRVREFLKYREKMLQ